MGILVKDKIEIVDAMVEDAKYQIVKHVMCDGDNLEEYVLLEVVEKQLERMRLRIKKLLVN